MSTDNPILRYSTNPEGRAIAIYARTWDHVVKSHPSMAGLIDTIVEITQQPEYREPSRVPGRERYFGRDDSGRWIRVVSEFAGNIDRVVTAFPQNSAPSGSKLR